MTATAFLALVAQPIGRADEFAVPWARIVLALLFCLALAWGAIVLLRRRSGLPPVPLFSRLLSDTDRDVTRQLELVERLHLSPTSHICLLRCGERRFLVHVSAAGAQLLARLDDDSGGLADL